MVKKGKFKVIEICQREKYEEVILRLIQNPDGDRFDELPSEILDKGSEYFVTFTPAENKEEPFNQ